MQGLLHDFDVYQGKGGDKGANVFGIGGDVVVKLCETLPKDVGHKIYLSCTDREIVRRRIPLRWDSEKEPSRKVQCLGGKCPEEERTRIT